MKKLKVVKKCESLAILIYGLCKELPNEERYGLCSQMQRAVVSVGSNIVEGQQRSDKEFVRFISIARGSLAELNFQLDICCSIYTLKILGTDIKEICTLIEEIGRMTYGLMHKLKAQAQKQ